jgi:hypothetical protein
MGQPVRQTPMFTPHRGLMALAERLARLAERRYGVQLWDGEEGLGSVVEQKLKELKVPEKPIQIGQVLTPRQLAEQTGFIRKKRTARRIK